MRAALSAAAIVATVLVPLTAAPAAAADPPENDLAVVANQDASKTCPIGWTTSLDNDVLLANPLTGALVQDLNKPAGIGGVLNEAKPFDHNNQIVALWGPSGGARGGVGVYDRKVGQWTSSFPLPADFGGGDGVAHSVAWLPGDRFVVAQTGTIGTSSQWGYVVLFDADGGQVQPPIPMTGAHGVEWDGAGHVYAIGDNHVAQYGYDEDGVLSPLDSWQLPLGPDGKRGGHDLRRRRTDARFLVTTNGAAWTFDPAITNDAAAFTEVRKTTAPLGGVKSMDQRFDGTTSYSYIPTAKFFFLDRPEKDAQFCAKPYKVRWIYGMDQPVYREVATATTTNATGAEPAPFQWERHKITRGDTLKVSGQIWAGKGAGDTTAASAAGKVTKAFQNDPELDVVYVKFYHWGDSGTPKIYNAHNATSEQLNGWVTYARAMAQAIGDEQAYVVIEPEWDANEKVCSTVGYRQALKKVIGEFRTYARNAFLINSIGLWKSDSIYQCFASTDTVKYPDTANLHKLFNAHGMLMHLVSTTDDCTLRDKYHPDYNWQPHFPQGFTLASARTFVSRLDEDWQYSLPRLRRLFQSSTVYLTDVAVTDCDWGDSGQTTLLKDLAGQLVNLYENEGLRGASFRSGGPDADECYMGVKNERGVDFTAQGGFRYRDNPSAVQTFTDGRTAMESYLRTTQQPADAPAFTSKVTAPSRAAAGSSVTFDLSVTNVGGPLTDGVVDFEIYDPSGTRVPGTGQKFWTGQHIAAGATARYPYTWTVPSTTGTYRLKAGVFSAGWAQEHHWNETLGSLVVDAAGNPAFTSSATASPSVVVPDATSTVTTTITNTGAALSGGTVTVYVTAPDGRVSASQEFVAQDVAAGAARTYTTTFTAPSTGGDYSLGVAVSGAGGAPEHHDNPSAGTVTVSTSKFTSSATATHAVVPPGGVTTVTATVKNTGTAALSGGIVDLYVYDNASTDGAVRRQTLTGESLAVGATKTYSWPVTMPATEGSYTLKIGVFNGSWQNLHWNNAALALGVAPPAFRITTMTTPATMQAGGPVTIATTVTNVGGHLDGAVVDVEITDAAGNRPAGGQKFWSGQSLGADPKSYSWPWTAPAALGTYTVKVGIFGTSGTTWTPRYEWIDRADTFVVADPAFVSTADVSASTVATGGTVTITATFENVGGSMTDGVTDIEVWTPAGTKDKAQSFPAQSIEHGRAKEYTWTWTAPATPGTYTVKLGAFNATWAKQWHWNNAAATISVGGATFQPSFRVGGGSNTWFVEIYTSTDVTGVDAIGDNGRFYLPLTKRSWGAWAATAPSELTAGKPIQLVARRSSDGATAASSQFTWLTSAPSTSPGWACSFTRGANVSTTWVEVVVSSAATGVDVKAGTGAWTALTYSAASGKWGRAVNIPAGTKVIFRARRADAATAYSPVYTWLS